MATMTITLAGDTDKYTAELWYDDMTTKVGDIPLNTPYVATGGSNFGTSNAIILRPIGDVVFDSYTSDITLSEPWKAGPEFTELNPIGDPWGDGLRGMFLSNVLITNVSNSPTFDIKYIGGSVVVTPFNRLHSMDGVALEDFAKVRLIETDVDGNQVFNYSVYIVNLLNIGFELPSSAIAGNSNIILGSLDTGINTPLFNTDSVTVDLGYIEVPASTSSLDYLSNTFELFLPFVESPIDIDPTLCIGKTIHIEYVIDLYTGDMTINLYNGEEKPFSSTKTTIGRNIPTKLVGETNYSITGTNGVINNVLTAYIRHTKPELVEGQFYNLVSKVGSIGLYKGYLEVDNMELQGKALADEKQQILSLLRNGVIIK
ncbi:MAG: hypothetical protein JXK16_11695 [Thiotrichales bacterium]|nr:hypothetical protein [Thiotrichales bacterium]